MRLSILATSLALAALALVPTTVSAQDSAGSGIGEKYQRRTAQRFDLISYLSNQKRIRAEQDAKWGYVKKGLPFEPDLVLSYGTLKGDVERTSALGELSTAEYRAQFFFNGLFVDSDKRRMINIDFGFEAFHKSGEFKTAAGSAQTDWDASETGGGILLRPFGRSSQDTGLFFKGGYASVSGQGLWSTAQTERKMAAPYWGGEAKLYLLPFLGARAEYTATSAKTEAALGGAWNRTHTTYGAFIELFVLSIEAQVFETQYLLKPTGGGAETRDTHKGIGLLGTLYF